MPQKPAFYVLEVLGEDSAVHITHPGPHPTDDILIQFEIRPRFEVFWFKMFSTDRNKILHMSRQCNCHDMCKFCCDRLNYSTPNFDQISNSIKIPLVHGTGGWSGAHICML